MRTVKLWSIVLGLTLWLFATLPGCNDETPPPFAPAAPQAEAQGNLPLPNDVINEIRTLESLSSSPGSAISGLAKSGKVVVLNSGSVNGLSAAIAAAGDRGVVLLRTGTHTENSLITITHGISIVGESGAILNLNTTPTTSAPPWAIQVSLHIRGTSDVTLWNLDVRPVGPVGGTAVVVENSPGTVIGNCRFTNFQWSVLMERSNRTMIWGNTFLAATGWSDGSIPEAECLININGDGVRVVNNDISGGFFGAFISGREGFFLNNNVHGNYVGLILCKVPAATYTFPGGNNVGSEAGASGWLAQGNMSEYNYNDGYLAIDGATKNFLVNNDAEDNGGYDIELAGDSYRYGFFTPRSFRNVVVAGAHKDVRIKNCGDDNHVIGGVPVDTNIEPCN